jgi:BirA family biotin operon repressor/biotin-[acetyl-CoA-carboxylase] ligase
MQPEVPTEKLPLCTFAAALALRESIRRLCPGLLPGVKWPNDIVLGGKKCAGILSELTFSPDGSPMVVMGIGLNVLQPSFPEEIRATATSLLLSLEEGKAACPTPGKLLSLFLEEVERFTSLMENDFSGFLASYRESSLTLGQKVRVLGKDEPFTGTALEIDETGALLVLTPSGETLRLLSGDVSVRGIMGYV